MKETSLNNKNSNKNINSSKKSSILPKWKIFLKINLWALAIFLGMILMTLLAVGGFSYSKFKKFTTAAQTTPKKFISQVKSGWHQIPTQTNHRQNVLILGVDSLATRSDSEPLTDTIMIASINLKNAHVSLLPLPRDLWNEAYKTRINALYTYGQDRYPNRPEQFPQEVITEMTGLDIHHTLVVSMKQVAEIIDLMGGIQLDIPIGFTDPQFPRTDVDVTRVHDPKLLYETVTFATGSAHLDGKTVLAYMRSRHGNHNQNTDQARSKRQQLVIAAVAKALLQPNELMNTEQIGKLYLYYKNAFSQQLSLEEIVATGKTLLPHIKDIKIINLHLPIYPTDQNGTIEHPAPYLYDNQWIYTIRNATAFKKNIQQQLNQN